MTMLASQPTTSNHASNAAAAVYFIFMGWLRGPLPGRARLHA